MTNAAKYCNTIYTTYLVLDADAIQHGLHHIDVLTGRLARLVEPQPLFHLVLHLQAKFVRGEAFREAVDARRNRALVRHIPTRVSTVKTTHISALERYTQINTTQQKEMTTEKPSSTNSKVSAKASQQRRAHRTEKCGP